MNIFFISLRMSGSETDDDFIANLDEETLIGSSYKCNQCGGIFKNKNQRKKHIRIAHQSKTTLSRGDTISNITILKIRKNCN